MGRRLTNRIAIVTGAAKGIGAGIAQVFARAGARVHVADIDVEAAEEVASGIRRRGGAATAHHVDGTDLSTMESLARHVRQACDRIDILHANIGVYPVQTIEDMAGDDWDRMMQLNLRSTFFAVKACAPYMKEQKYGRIVITSSITGPIVGYPGMTHYAASKAGQMGFVRAAALELAPYGITVNAVQPGTVHTETLAALGDDFVESAAKNIPLGKLADVEDIGYAALFLASDEAKYITGQGIVVDGGQTLPESPWEPHE